MRKLLVIGFIGLLVVAGLLFTRKTTTAQTAPSMPAAQSGPAGSTNPASAPTPLHRTR